VDVRLDCRDADPGSFANLRVGEILSDQAGNFFLTDGEPVACFPGWRIGVVLSLPVGRQLAGLVRGEPFLSRRLIRRQTRGRAVLRVRRGSVYPPQGVEEAWR
jgi:hypothetical protein